MTLNLGDQADTLNAASGSQRRLTVNAGDGNDTVNGGSKRNIIDGGAGDDVLAGGPANDDFYGGTGADRFTGGAGLDRVFYADHGAGVTADIEPTGPAIRTSASHRIAVHSRRASSALSRPRARRSRRSTARRCACSARSRARWRRS